jgi:hypothetical protein
MLKHTSLETRFKAFVQSIAHCECIDDLVPPEWQHRRADYFFYDRGIIGEVKYLTEDRGETVSQKLNDLANSDPSFPQFFGTVHVEEVMRNHPDGVKFRNWLCNYAARNLEALLRSAHHQIQDTRTYFKLNRSIGVLIILNEGIELYDDDFVYQEVSRILHKKDKEGNLERDQIDAVWFINEYNSANLRVSSSVFIGPAAKNDQTGVILKMLQIRWASYNGYAIQEL